MMRISRLVDILGIQLSLVTEAATTTDTNDIVDRVVEPTEDDTVVAVDKFDNNYKIPTSLPVAEETIGNIHLMYYKY